MTMSKFLLNTLSSACVIAFITYLRFIDIFFTKDFWILLGMFLSFGLVALLQGSVMGGDNYDR